MEQPKELSVYETFNQISLLNEMSIFWGKYGKLALNYLKEQNPDYYVELLMTSKTAHWVHSMNDRLTAHRLVLLNNALDASPLKEEATIEEIAAHHIHISNSLESSVSDHLKALMAELKLI